MDEVVRDHTIHTGKGMKIAPKAKLNDWLNKKLNRSEFMPFAPIILEEKAHEYFEINGLEFAATFMTITAKAKKICREKCPGIVHIDGTSRPQMVEENDNQGLYKILKTIKRKQ